MASMKLLARSVLFAAFATVLATTGQFACAALPQPGDIAFGLSNSDPTLTLELVRGSAVVNGGGALATPWTSIEFVEIVEFDNLGGVAHNVHGNLIGVDFGGPSDTGKIYNLATTVDPSPSPAQKIGDTVGLGGAGLSLNRLGGLSVSPNNSKIALMGYSTGAVLVYDYTAGDSMGAGAALSGGRQTADNTLDGGHTQGTVWKDNNTVLAFSALGNVFEINSTTMAATLKKTVTTPPFFANFTSLAYEPSISPYLYASFGGFDGVATVNKLYVLDPASSYNVVKEIDLSTSLQTAREIALDKNGNLFMSQYGGSGTPGAKLDFIPGSMILNPATLTDNSSVDWYQSSTLSSFSSFDIGFGLPGDFNGNRVVDAADYTVWRDGLGSIYTPADYDVWKTHYGQAGGSGSEGPSLGTAVPEPRTLTIFLAAALCVLFVRMCRR